MEEKFQLTFEEYFQIVSAVSCVSWLDESGQMANNRHYFPVVEQMHGDYVRSQYNQHNIRSLFITIAHSVQPINICLFVHCKVRRRLRNGQTTARHALWTDNKSSFYVPSRSPMLRLCGPCTFAERVSWNLHN